MSTNALAPRRGLGLEQLPMVLLGLACLQFYLGILEPLVESLGYNAGLIRVIRHAHLAPLGLAFIAMLTLRGLMEPLARPVATWIRWIVVLIVLMFFLGVLRGVFLGAALLDAGVYEAFVVAFVVGARHENWEWCLRLFRVLFYVGATLMAFELLVIETADRQESISSVAYQIRAVLFAWPLLLFTSPMRKNSEKIAMVVGMALIVIMYVLFQKRAPTVRVLFAILIFLWLLPGVSKPVRMKLRLAIVGGICGLVMASPWITPSERDTTNIVSESSVALASRFQAEGGLFDMITKENERWIEAGFFFDEANGIELMIGKGFGGAVPVPWWWPPRMKIVENGQTYYGVYSMHIGLTHPLLKGGFVFWFLFFGGWIVFLLRYRRYRSDPRALACWAVVALNFLFMSVETLWGSGNVVTVIMVGFCMGYLGNRKFWERPDRQRLEVEA